MPSSYYFEYLKSDHWRNLKLSAFNKYGRFCNFCGNRKRIEVHHLRYPNPLESATEEDVVPLCERCHKSAHKIMSMHVNRHLDREALNVLVCESLKSYDKPYPKKKRLNRRQMRKRARLLGEIEKEAREWKAYEKANTSR